MARESTEQILSASIKVPKTRIDTFHGSNSVGTVSAVHGRHDNRCGWERLPRLLPDFADISKSARFTMIVCRAVTGPHGYLGDFDVFETSPASVLLSIACGTSDFVLPSDSGEYDKKAKTSPKTKATRAVRSARDSKRSND